MTKSLLFCLACAQLAGGVSAATVHNLRCEYLKDPLGIDATKPGLSWVIKSGQRGEVQTAYQVLVASSPQALAKNRGDIWDSGKVASDQSAQVRYSGKPLASRMRCYWKVRVWDRKGKPSAWSQPALWTMGLLSEEDWKGCWIGARPGTPSGKRVPLLDGDRAQTGPIDPADAPAVLLRREATLPKRPIRATATICGLGYYELYVNGKRVGDHVLDPAFTDYMRRVLYVTYDVADLVRSGQNALGVMLGNGFYCLQTPDLFQLEKAPWRTPPRMRMNLVVEFDDGSTSTIASDGKWKQAAGEILFNCIRGGETIDARKDPGRWLEAGYDDSAWKPALEVSAPLGRLCAQSLPPIRITDQFKPLRITGPKPGVYVADFGRNLAGWVRWTTSGKEGQTVTLDFNERLREDGTVDTGFQTTHTYGRYQHQECILSGAKNEVFEPHFTYHAFRYVEFRGLEKAPAPEDMVALRMHTQLPCVSSFECSDVQLNQLHDAARRTLEDCTWGGPAAEPVREKVIWLGDDNFCLDAYFYLFDCSSLYRKQVYDLMEDQEPNGHFGPVIPTGGWGEQGEGSVSGLHFCDSPWWSIALALGVNRLGTDYGDRRTSEISYDACRRYTDYLTSTSQDGILSWGLGDWLPRAGSIETKQEFTSTVAYYYQAKLVAEQAAALGKKQDAAKYSALAETIKTAFNGRFFDAAAGRYAQGSQTAQSLPLMHDVAPAAERKRVLNSLVEAVKASGNKLSTGFIGTMPTFYVLTDAGYGDLAYEMVKDGWFHMLANGDASTLGESPYTRYGQYGSGHHQFGACVAGWMYRCLAGIRPDLSGPGYKKLTIKPAIISKLNWVKAHYDCVYGRIVSNWKRDGEKLTLEVTIPANTTATVFVPAREASSVTEGGKPIDKAEGVKFLRMEGSCAVYEIGSGHYAFESTLPASPARITVAAYYYPCTHPDPRWDKAKYPGFTEWDLIKAATQRFPGHRQPKVPVWGYTDESRPEAMEQKIAAAAAHGVDAFIFDWYYYDDGPYLEGALDKGFLQATNNARIKFALMWANHDWYDIQGYNPADKIRLLYPGKVKPETWDTICDMAISKYFKHPSYWKIDGQPYFSIYEMGLFLDSFGSVESARAALDKFRGKVRAAGFPGLHANAILWGRPNLPGGKTPADWPKLCRDLGLDSLTGYTWVHHGALDYTTFPVSDYVKGRETYLRFWADAAAKYPIPYFPNAMIAWDNSPRAAAAADWSKPGAHVVNPVVVGNTPRAFRESLEIIKARLLAASTQPKVITINAWNEWPEGSCLEPEKEYGYGYLEAVKAVFEQ